MQRYFLIFSIIFLSYLLLINYNPPQEETNSDKSLIDSEYSQLIQEEAFVSKDFIFKDLIAVSWANELINKKRNKNNILLNLIF